MARKRSARIRGDERGREREGVIKGIVGGGKEREQPPAAAPTSGLINLMVSVDTEGLSKDGERGGRRGSTERRNRLAHQF